MKIDEVKLLYDYNYWANRRILATCTKVSLDQYVAPAGFGTGYGSLRASLVHILDAEWAWRRACQAFSVAPAGGNEGSSGAHGPKQWNQKELTEADLPTLDALNARWQAEEQEMRAYLGTLSDQQLNGILRYGLPNGVVRERVVWHCLYHAVNHGTQHRSEAAALLTSYGQSPGDVDFTLFLNERSN